MDQYLNSSGVSPLVTPTSASLKSPESLLQKIEVLTDSQFLEGFERKLQIVSLQTKAMLEKLIENELDKINLVHSLFAKIDDKEKLLDQLFMNHAMSNGILSNPSKYVTISIAAMKHLQQNGKSNLVYKWPQCINRQNGEGKHVLSVNRMPFGLLQYQIEFFSASNTMSVHESADYSMWLDTMEADFGGRFMKLFRGPMWSAETRDKWKDPEYAKVNIACTSKRQHQNKEAQLGFSTDPGLQVKLNLF